MPDFTGRRAIVTGAGSGIGKCITEQLLYAGAEVVAADINPIGAQNAALHVTCDVSEIDQFAQLVDTARERLGGIDLLFNNAGIGSTTSVLDATPEEWDRVFAVNARGTFLGTKLVLPYMLDQGYGVIINTASVAGMVGLRDRASYCASKGAVIALTKQIAVQYAGTGIRCNCISPGTVDSPWVNRLLAESDDPETALEALIARQPIGRLGKPEEVAAAALYLASDDASFITGASFVIDGGLTAA